MIPGALSSNVPLTVAEYDAFADATSNLDWNAALVSVLSARQGRFPSDYIERIALSGICAAVWPRWDNEQQLTGAPLADAELRTIDAAKDNHALAQCIACICQKRGALPSDYVTSLIDTGRMLETVNKYARPTP